MNVRPATSADLPALAELYGSVEEAVLGHPSRLDASVVEGWLHGVPMETNTWLLEEDGRLVAAAFGAAFGERGNSAGAVHPSAMGRGLGTQLLELLEGRLAGEGVQRIHSWAVAGDTAADELFRGRGYRDVRRFWEMAIELDEEPDVPDVEVETFREEDARAFYAALDESFEDHWEHQTAPFEDWWERHSSKDAFDPSLWFLIREDDEIAGVARNDLNRAGGGYVGGLGVRRPWRGRGYGRALLLHSFREFRRRGMTRATLGVDAANAWGATKLYESVGMHVEQENVVWEKLLA